MDWIEKLNHSINYIEENLEGKIDFEKAAQIACCSTFNFQRMFSYIAGVTLSEYIRRRRMSKAAYELQNYDIRIMDLSIKYGYDSPTSFSRAFQSVHNLSPSTARQKGIILKTYPKLSFSLSVKGDSEMKYRIEEKPAIRLIGIRKKISANMEMNFQTIPELWGDIKQTSEFQFLCEINNQLPQGILGVTEYKGAHDLNYYIAAATDKPVPDEMVEYTVPAATWAVFETSLDEYSIKELYRRFYTEWLPFSGYKYSETHDIEVYPLPNGNSQKCEIWFAIKTQGH